MGKMKPERSMEGSITKKVVIIACCCVWEITDIISPKARVFIRKRIDKRKRRNRLPLTSRWNQ